MYAISETEIGVKSLVSEKSKHLGNVSLESLNIGENDN